MDLPIPLFNLAFTLGLTISNSTFNHKPRSKLTWILSFYLFQLLDTVGITMWTVHAGL